MIFAIDSLPYRNEPRPFWTTKKRFLTVDSTSDGESKLLRDELRIDEAAVIY